MRVGYFPGCSLHSTAKEYDRSTRVVCEHLGIELVELPDWNCCGSTLARSSDVFLSVVLPGRNLAIAESTGLDVVAPCAVCYNRFRQAQYDMSKDASLRGKVVKAIEMDYKGTTHVYSPVNYIAMLGAETVKSKVVKPLEGLRVVAYYGCLLVRPPEILDFDDSENPMLLDRIMSAAGATVLDWSHKTECCGGSLAVSRVDVVQRLVNEIMVSAEVAGAECIVTACPLCQTNLEIHQSDARERFNGTYELPVYYFTELLEAAFGKGPKESLRLASIG